MVVVALISSTTSAIVRGALEHALPPLLLWWAACGWGFGRALEDRRLPYTLVIPWMQVGRASRGPLQAGADKCLHGPDSLIVNPVELRRLSSPNRE